MKLFRKSAALVVAVVAASASLIGMSSASAAGPTFSIKANGYCWTPYGGNYENNLDFVLWTCSDNNASQQKFWWDDYGRLRYDGKCVLPYGRSQTEGADIVMYDCGSGDPSQYWSINTEGFLVTFVGMCVVPKGGSWTDNTLLTQWECPGQVGAATPAFSPK